MTTLFIISAIRDLIPDHPEPYPKDVINYSQSLYSSSKLKCPLSVQFEIARYHLCCYLTIEKFKKKFKLPDPMQDKIPIPTRKLRNIIINFRKSMFPTDNVTDGASMVTPPATPRKKGLKNPDVVDMYKTPKNSHQNHSTIFDSPITPKSLTDKLQSTLTNDLKVLSNKKVGRPRKAQIQDNALSPYKKQKQLITTPILITFVNKFYIPKNLTLFIINFYKDYQFKVKNSWGLLVGIVAFVYLKLNHLQISSNINLRIKLFKNLLNLQQGGLTESEIFKWHDIVKNLVKNMKWVNFISYKESEFDDLIVNGDNDGEDDPMSSLASFIDDKVKYCSNERQLEYNRWLHRVSKFVARNKNI